MRSESTEFVHIPVTSNVVLTAQPVSVGFVTVKSATPATWYAATHEPGGVRVLVGPGAGGVVLAEGKWFIVLRITDNPEIPVLDAGQLRIT